MVGRMPSPCEYACRLLVGSIHEETGIECQDVVENVMMDNMSLHMVLDGHGPKGEQVARFGGRVLMEKLRELVEDDVEAAIKEAFGEAAEKVEESGDAEESGATASVVVWGGGKFAVGNVGDSVVVWGKGGKDAVVLSENHRANDEGERKRVEKVGAIVQGGYVSDGTQYGKVIGVTRALGDLDVKKLGVISEPFVKQVEIEGERDFVILATDGLWDAHGGVSPQKAVDVVREALENEGEDGGIRGAVNELMMVARGRERLPMDDAAIVVIKVGEL